MKIHAMAVASALAIAPALAQWDGPYRSYSYSDRSDRYADRGEYARVVESTPVYAAQREECWNSRTGAYEERRDQRSRIGAGAAVGALAGGVIGHQIDHGEGTAAGAILGGIIGHQIERAQRDDDLDLSNCRLASYDSGIEGYDVRYRYAGNEYTTRMAYDPGRGRTLRLGSDVNWDGTPFG